MNRLGVVGWPVGHSRSPAIQNAALEAAGLGDNWRYQLLPVSPELFDEAARRATDDLDPPADLHGSSDYRKTVAAAVVRRGLRAAADNAARGSD